MMMNIQGLWKDFQGHISQSSRIPFSAKKSLEFLVLPQHEQFYSESISVVAPFPLVWITLAGLSGTDLFFKFTFYFKIQGLSRTFKERANPGWRWWCQ